MTRYNRYAHFFYLLVDIILISVSFFVTCLLNPSVFPQDLEAHKSYFSVFIFWTICQVFIFNIYQLYRTSRNLNISREVFIVGKGVISAAILAALFIFLLKIDVFSRIVFVESTLLIFLVVSIWRFVKRVCVRQLIVRGFANYNVLIIGANKQAETLIQEIRDNPYFGFKIVGILDNNEIKSIAEFKLLGGLDKLEYAVKKFFIDEIYITKNFQGPVLQDIVLRCLKLGRTVRLMTDDFGIFTQKLSLGYLGLVPLITYFEEVQTKANGLSKRLFDIVISGILSVFLFPMFVVIAACIVLETKGPVFYIAKRSGKKGEVFNFYKFRSMVHNAESLKAELKHKSEVDGPIFKIKQDPRTTKVGKFLRQHSLDELPQLINVFKGNMSLVGPRPFPVDESNNIEYKHIPRLNIRPGITGLAQIRGRSDLKFSQWMRWDIWYVKNWSLGLDIKILLWTIPVVLKRRGAY
jgi:exopolysaccharide biosynthesis polyprenyl glycosylphosphotransferase